ncbi:hypothetical protein [Maridesulfovibrio sp.]|uniref:hypothetical protein n=1 Tax=Maridesulfovibrio sp. TaxID=2795000 RepID=UPI002A18AFF1|nr:hypothetical protein [Maridesulfovibrio sp.]
MHAGKAKRILPSLLNICFLIALILMGAGQSLSQAAEAISPAFETTSLIEGKCVGNSTNCVSFFVSPAQNCKTVSTVANKTFYDNMTTSFSMLKEDGSFGPTYPVTTGPKFVHMLNGTIWKVNTLNQSFPGSPYTCMIKVVGGENGWDYAQDCSVSSTSENCTGCAHMSTPGQVDNNSGFVMINSGCVEGNPAIASYGHAYLLDYKNGNFLFRGPHPTVMKDNKWVFDQKGLLAALKSRSMAQLGKPLPDSYIFVDISLINDTGEGPMLKAEYTHFNGTSSNLKPDSFQPATGTVPLSGTNSTGKFLWWQMLTEGNGGGNASKLPGLVDYISTTMNNNNKTPYVIYFHCSAGEDRTGEVAISYLMNNRMSEDINAAYVYGTTIFTDPANSKLGRTTPKNPVSSYFQGVKWYCSQNSSWSCDFSDTTTVPGDQGTCLYPWSKDKEQNACVWAGQN